MTSHITEITQQYAREYLEAKIAAGLTVLYKIGLLRHYYFFHKVDKENGKRKRYIFYQIPYSEWKNNSCFKKGLIKFFDNKITDWRTKEPDWEYKLADDREFNQINSLLAGDFFKLPFDNMQKFFSLFEQGDFNEIKLFPEGEIQKNIAKAWVDFVNNKRPINYPDMLFDLEKEILIDSDYFENTLFVPLYYDHIWYGVLILNIEFSNLPDLENYLLPIKPYIEEKIYQTVVKKRFLKNPLQDIDEWTLDYLSRIAATAGFTKHIDPSPESSNLKFSSHTASKAQQFCFSDIRYDGRLFEKVCFGETERDCLSCNPDDAKNSYPISQALEEVQDYSKRVYELRDAYIKTAISAIMSRNGSHNIGSHVINRVVEIMDFLNIQDHKYFMRYLQQRMDFVAQISTEFPRWSTSHWFAKEIMRNFYSQRHLLNYIAESEGLKAFEKEAAASSLIPEKLQCIIKNVKKYECAFQTEEIKESRCGEATYFKCTECANFNNPQILVCDLHKCVSDLSQDIPIAVPGGMIGFHAFYTILENFLRNTAKHCFAPYPSTDLKKANPMFLTLKVLNDESKDYYTVILRDNYSYISGLVEYMGVEDVDNLEGHKIIVVDHADSVSDNTVSDEKYAINFTNFNDFRIEEVGQDSIVFIIDDGGICRENHEYENLMKLNNVRFIEKAYWRDFLDSHPSDEMNVNALISFLGKYYEADHIKINKKIMNSIIEEDGSLRKSDWGIAEMKISAGYLNGRRIEEIGGSGKENLEKLICAVPVPEYDHANRIRAYRLGYKFRLKKPVDVLLVWDGCKAEDELRNYRREAISPVDKIKVGEHSGEMAVIADESDELFKKLIKLSNNLKNDEVSREIKILIEGYPTRLFIVATNETYDKLTLLLNKNKFLKNRIVLLKKEEEFEAWINADKDASDDRYLNFKNKLLEKWLTHLKIYRGIDGKAINLIIQPEENRTNGSGGSADERDIIKLLSYITVMANKADKIKETDEESAKKLKKIWQSKLKNVLNNEINSVNELGLSINSPFGSPAILNKEAKDLNKNIEKIIGRIYGFEKDTKNKLPSTLPDIFDYEDKKISIGDWNGKELCRNAAVVISNEEKYGIENIIRYFRHWEATEEKNKNKYFYREKLTGGAMHFHLFAYPPEWAEMAITNLVENGLMRIGIMDERVAGSSIIKSGRYYEQMKVAKLVFIKDFHGVSLDYAGWTPEPVVSIKDKQSDQIDFDILIVHQGILDKIQKIKNKSKEEIESILLDLKEKVPYIFVTSGRGKPESIPAGVKFIPFSIIESTLLQKPHSKYLLVKQLLGGLSD